jgi:hypothetical protein
MSLRHPCSRGWACRNPSRLAQASCRAAGLRVMQSKHPTKQLLQPQRATAQDPTAEARCLRRCLAAALTSQTWMQVAVDPAGAGLRPHSPLAVSRTAPRPTLAGLQLPSKALPQLGVQLHVVVPPTRCWACQAGPRGPEASSQRRCCLQLPTAAWPACASTSSKLPGQRSTCAQPSAAGRPGATTGQAPHGRLFLVSGCCCCLMIRQGWAGKWLPSSAPAQATSAQHTVLSKPWFCFCQFRINDTTA